MPGLGHDIFIHHFGIWFESVRSDVVLHDVRFVNEADAIRKLGGTIIRIKRADADCVMHTHASELDIDKIVPDYYIENNQDLAHLLSEIDRIYTELQGPRP